MGHAVGICCYRVILGTAVLGVWNQEFSVRGGFVAVLEIPRLKACGLYLLNGTPLMLSFLLALQRTRFVCSIWISIALIAGTE